MNGIARTAGTVSGKPPENTEAHEAVLEAGSSLSGDSIFRWMVTAAGVGVLLLLGGIIIVMIGGGVQAFGTFGLSFFTTSVWNPVTQHFGALAPVFGTIATSLIGLVVAVPLAFGAAFWLTQMAPARVAAIVGMAVRFSRQSPPSSSVCGAFLLSCR